MLPKAEGVIQLQNANGLPKGKPSDGRKKKLWLRLDGVQKRFCTPSNLCLKFNFKKLHIVQSPSFHNDFWGR